MRLWEWRDGLAFRENGVVRFVRLGLWLYEWRFAGGWGNGGLKVVIGSMELVSGAGVCKSVVMIAPFGWGGRSRECGEE